MPDPCFCGALAPGCLCVYVCGEGICLFFSFEVTVGSVTLVLYFDGPI